MKKEIWEKYDNIDAAIYEKEQQINKIYINWDDLVNKNSEEKVSQILDKLQEEKEELIRSACSFLSNRNNTLMREGTKTKKEIKEHQKLQEEKVQIQKENISQSQPVTTEQPKPVNTKEDQKKLLKKEQILLEIKRKILAKEISLEDASKLVQKVAAVYGKKEEQDQPKSMKKVA